jgi:Uma2 family endonuclease
VFVRRGDSKSCLDADYPGGLGDAYVTFKVMQPIMSQEDASPGWRGRALLSSEFMTTTVKKPATYEDLRALPETVVGELIGGELSVSPRPASRHVLVASTLGIKLGGPFQLGEGGPGGWWSFDEPELHFGKDVLVPDLAGWKRSRMPVPPDAPFFTLPPDWVCEVLSPSTAVLDRVRKMPVYMRERVGHVWLIDPVSRTLEVFRREEDRWVLAGNHGGEQGIRAEPFEAVELELKVLWLPSP